MTKSPETFERSVIMSSVMPSAKYSWSFPCRIYWYYWLQVKWKKKMETDYSFYTQFHLEGSNWIKKDLICIKSRVELIVNCQKIQISVKPNILRNTVKWKYFDFDVNRPNFDGTATCGYLAMFRNHQITLWMSCYFRISLVLSLTKIGGNYDLFGVIDILKL